MSLWLLPCQFASGHERTAASSMGVDKLEGPDGAASTLAALSTEKTDCVVQLGGDMIFGRRLAKSAGVPLLSYAYGPKKGLEKAKTVFTAYPKMAESMPGAEVIGDLVKDSLGMAFDGDKKQNALPAKIGERRLLLCPGSRPAIRGRVMAWFTEIVRDLKCLASEVEHMVLLPVFAPDAEVAAWRDAGLNAVKATPLLAMKSADYALTQPGTNNLEMMHCGLPCLVAVPMDFLNLIPVSGLPGLLGRLPVLGPRLKERALQKKLSQRSGFLSWPNWLAGRAIIDEVSGEVSPRRLALNVTAAIRDPDKLSRVSAELLNMSGEAGAAQRLCNAIEGS